MGFSGNNLLGPPLARISLLVISIACLALLFAASCSNEGQQENEKPKALVRVKVPRPPLEKAPEETKAEPEKATIEAPPSEQQKPGGISKPKEGEPPIAPVEKEGYYRVHVGESLYEIAGHKDVYGDPLKWPSLFRLNMESLAGLEAGGALELKRLPEGLDLRFLTESEVRGNLSKQKGDVWAINVLSSQTSQKLSHPAIKLMNRGYRVYITKARVKGNEWMRLRVGFFEDRSEASKAGKKISALMNGPTWVTKINKKELKEFGGY